MAEGVAVAGQVRATGGPAGGTPGFQRPPEIPWSELGPDFIEAWGHDESGQLQAEHWEVEGQSGSGKSYAVGTALQQRAARWGTAEIAVITKNTDDSMPLLGWPVIDGYAGLRQYRWAMFWPQTTAVGEEREKFHEARIYDLLSRRLKKLVRMYWREGRSHGISIIAGAQRPLEMVRDMHSEARWKAVFCPADEADMERFAQLLGPHRDWEPVLRSLDQNLHQFVLKNTFTKDAYITWIDQDLRPLPSQADQKASSTPAGAPYGGQKKTAVQR